MSFARHVRPRLAERLQALGLDVAYTRALGDHLYLEEGGREVAIFDAVGGLGASLLGHNHPDLVARLTAVLCSQRPFNAQGSMREAAGRLGEALSERVGPSDRTWVSTFANSGSEAVEAALKHAELERTGRLDRLREDLDFVRTQARQLGVEASSLDRAASSLESLAVQCPTTLAVVGAFHGKTGGALGLTHRPGYREPFAALGGQTAFVPHDDPAALHEILEALSVPYLSASLVEGVVRLEAKRFVNVTALFVEPIQGEGGVVEIGTDALVRFREAADAGGFPLVFDEIQSGMGRTGTFLASEPSGVHADYVLLGKSLGGGLCKISALMVDEERYLPRFGMLHTSTFADDALSCEVALAVLETLDRDGLMGRCTELGAYTLDALGALQRRHPTVVGEVRGRGLMLGLEILPQAGSPLIAVTDQQEQLGWVLAGALLHHHRIRVLPTLGRRATLRLQPSARVTRAQIDGLIRALDQVFHALDQGSAGDLFRFLTGSSAPGRRGIPKTRARLRPASTQVGFITHFLSPRDLLHWDRSLGELSEAECEVFLERTRGSVEPFVFATPWLASATGSSVRAQVYALPLTAAQAHADPAWAHAQIQLAVDRARDQGCTLMGLGGHTSILTKNGTTLRAPEIGLTSGNALTSVAALEGLLVSANEHVVGERVLGIVGAAGNIGRALAHLAADQVDRLILIGRGARRLHRLAQTLPGDVVVGDLGDLRQCSMVLSATNAVTPILTPELLASDRRVVVADVAVPRDVALEVGHLPHVALMTGGLVTAPLGQQVEVPGMHLGPGEIYGCLAETLLLGLAGASDGFTGDLCPSSLEQIRTLARVHGFGFRLQGSSRLPCAS